jgi:uncharacterized protein
MGHPVAVLRKGSVMTEHQVVDDADAGRFELRVGDEVAGFVEYSEEHGALAFTHTVVEPQHEGQGIGSALARGALDAARRRGRAVLPHCPFVRSWISKHPDHLDLVPADRRGEFGLAPEGSPPDHP